MLWLGVFWKVHSPYFFAWLPWFYESPSKAMLDDSPLACLILMAYLMKDWLTKRWMFRKQWQVVKTCSVSQSSHFHFHCSMSRWVDAADVTHAFADVRAYGLAVRRLLEFPSRWLLCYVVKCGRRSGSHRCSELRQSFLLAFDYDRKVAKMLLLVIFTLIWEQCRYSTHKYKIRFSAKGLILVITRA